jgi:hypothetical protein
MTAQGDWLDHARRHLDRAQEHRDQGELEYARNELAEAISDIWTASDEIVDELESPRPVHFILPSDLRSGEVVECRRCGRYLHQRGEWAHLTRMTIHEGEATCEGDDDDTSDSPAHGGLVPPGR